MSSDAILQSIEQLVNESLAASPELFLVEVRIKPTNNVRVYVDGDNGLSIEKCAQLNRKLYKRIDETAIFPGSDFSLEVSSPGLDRPLKLQRQYFKNIGRKIEVLFNDGTKKTGKLLQVTAADILLEEITGTGRKAETHQLVIPFSNIKTTTVQIQF